MNKYIKNIFLGAALVGLASCQDFLDREPESSLIPESYFTEAALLQAYVQPFYEWLPSHSNYSYGLGTFSTDNGTDNQVGLTMSSMYQPGVWLVPDNSSSWDFQNIRRVNYFFDQAQANYDAGAISGSKTLIDQTMGEAHFFRAYAYYVRYKTFGDFPIFTEALPDLKDVLLENSVRQPRNKVARFILDELTQAANLLPETSSKGKNGLNKACAHLLRSRVALFEGTWLKYHKGTAFVPGGKGWPGNTETLGNFDIDAEINYFFTEAMASAKIVGDQLVDNLVENTDAPEGQNAALQSLNPYYTMFCDVDLSNYSEVLLYRSYSVAQRVTTQIQAQFQKNGGGSGWTRGLVNSFLMRNGLPIYDSNSGYDKNWENEGVSKTLTDRDSRICIFTKGDNCIDTYQLGTGEPVYWREGWLLDGTAETRPITGFAIKKGKGYDYAEATGNDASVTGSITFRGTEAMLNYMEACVEKTGNVDETAANYWKALRRRAKVDEDYTKTVAATIMTEEAKGDWGAYSHNALVSPLLYNVRRERRNELIGEALRMDDLRRWRAMDQLVTTPYNIEGIKYWGTCYNDPDNALCLKDMDGNYLAPVVNNTGTGTMSPESESAYVRPFQITGNAACTFITAHYLNPIGHSNFTRASTDGTVATTVIYQNPGWKTETGTTPSAVE